MSKNSAANRAACGSACSTPIRFATRCTPTATRRSTPPDGFWSRSATTCRRASPPRSRTPPFTRRFMAMWAVNMAVGIDRMGDLLGRPLTEDEVEPVNWAQAEHAKRLSGVQYAEALVAVMEFRRAVRAWWEVDGWDLLLTPTLAEPPVRIGEHLATPDDPMAGMKRAAEFVGFTPPFNATGQPAMSVPLNWNADGLPVGLQLVAAYGREDLLLAVASQLEQAQPWADRRPPVC